MRSLMVCYIPKEIACDCVCLLCRLKVDLANLAGTSLPAEVQAQIKAQLMDITKRRTEVQQYLHHATVEHVTLL